MNVRGSRRRLLPWIPLLLVLLCTTVISSPESAHAAGPAYVQGGAKEVRSGTTNALSFGTGNGAGNLVVAYVVWNNTGTATVTDSRGNAYASAGPATRWRNNGWSAQVFYASNVKAGSNTVTASFSTSITSFGILYIHEYSGIDPTAPLDVTASASGTSRAMNSGSATTTSGNDLIFGGGASSSTVTAGGSGFTTRSTAFGNRTEDRLVTSPAATTQLRRRTPTHGSCKWWRSRRSLRRRTTRRQQCQQAWWPRPKAQARSTSAGRRRPITSAWPVTTSLRNGAKIGTSPTTSFSDTNLIPSTAYSYSASAYDAAGNTSNESQPATATTLDPPPPDNTPPTVSVSGPAAGATVSGVTIITATANDNVAVAGVSFAVDGVAVGSEDTSSPYSYSWDTTSGPNGSHSLTATARDTAGNTTTSPPVSVTVANSADGPVAAYAFEEGAGTSTTDLSGHGLTGTLTNGPVWTAGKYGEGLRFDGGDDYVNLGNPTGLHLTGSMTISAWIYSSAFPGDDAAVVSKRGTGENGFQLDTTVDTGPRTIGFKLTNSASGPMFRYGATPLQLNSWYFVTGVYNAAAGTLEVYLNGQLDNGTLIGTITSAQINSSLNVNIGRRASGAFLFNGTIDDVRIYNRALSPAEILVDMTTPLAGSAGDTTPPTVTIDSPAPNAQVTDIVNVTADADDDVAVAGVQFLVDGTADRRGGLDRPLRRAVGHAHRQQWCACAHCPGAGRLRKHRALRACHDQRGQHELFPERDPCHRVQFAHEHRIPPRRPYARGRTRGDHQGAAAAVHPARSDAVPPTR